MNKNTGGMSVDVVAAPFPVLEAHARGVVEVIRDKLYYASDTSDMESYNYSTEDFWVFALSWVEAHYKKDFPEGEPR